MLLSDLTPGLIPFRSTFEYMNIKKMRYVNSFHSQPIFRDP